MVGLVLLGGVTLQIIGVLLNKYTNFFEHDVVDKSHPEDYVPPDGRRRMSDLNDRMWVDVAIDLASAGLFLAAGFGAVVDLL